MMDEIVNAQVGAYLAQLIPPRDSLLQELETQAREGRIPICGPQVGTLLFTLAAATRPRRALELGTAIGYSAIWIGRALAPLGGRLTTIEIEPSTAAKARLHLQRAGLTDVVEVVGGAALDVLPTLVDPVEFVFIDAVKSEYPDYLPHAIRLLRPGGVLLADNILLGGSVADPTMGSRWSSAFREGIRHFTELVCAHPALRTVILPLRDGLSLSVRL